MIWSISVSETTIPESYFTMYFSIMRRAIKSTQTTIRRFSYVQTKIKRNGSHRRKSVLLKFAVPVILGNLFQLFYTLADSVIVGKTLGADSDLLAHQILRWMQIPDDISGEAYDYMFVVFLGTGATVFYNMIPNMLRALGDSKTPLYFLVFSSVLNIFLDILFIVPFHMGVAGAAWATILSQFLSALFSLIVGLKNVPVLLQSPDIRLLPRQIRFQIL